MDPLNTPEVAIEQRGPVGVLRIQRPTAANAMSRPVLLAIGAFARWLVSSDELRAGVITGSGDKYFCAGADLKERAGWSDDDIRDQLALYRTELGALDRCPKVVIAAVNGLALGGGLEIALACDLRVASANAAFAAPEVTLGIIPGAGGTQRLARLVGEARAKEMILLGRRVDASQALNWGLVNHVAHDGDLLEQVIAWADPLVNGAPLAQSAALRAIDAACRHDFEQGLDVEQLCYERVLRSQDRLEGLQAFREKRRPVFRGQ